LRVFEDSSELEGITALAVDPSDPQVVYAGTGFCHFRLGCHGRLLRSGDEGSSWVQVSAPGYVTAVAVDPNPPHALYTNAAQSFPMGPTVSLETNTGLQSFDGGRSWTNIPGRFPPVRIAEFLFDAGKPGTILVGSPEGISRSVDGGQTWNAISNGLRNLAVRAVCLGNDSAFYAATSDGVYKSSDQGAFWSATGFASPAVAVVSNRHGLFVASPGTGVFESRDAGATWTATNEGLTDLSVRTLALEPQGTLHAGTDSGVFDLSLRNLPRVVGER
jgi:photosystem II stability/assembly factor-like uncharacterized protein